tara:strand:- start:3117 stop:3359 length:243 start_codon:yes stop_codon:yes gene_type:complete
MILYDAANLKVGSTDVSQIRLGSDLVWSSETGIEGIWTFSDTPGDTIVLTATFSPGKSTVDWGDSNTNELTSDASFTHTY